MADNMTLEQIHNALLEHVGETGNAELRHGNDLYIQKEENGQWWFIGTVEDAVDAERLITEYFA